MRLFGIAVLAFLLAALATVSASGYKITKVIEVGPADIGPMVWPFKWSPNGSYLAYYNDGVLNVCDTVGKNINVFSFDVRPHQYEWLSDYEILIHGFRDTTVSRRPGYYNRLIRVNIFGGKQETLEEYLRLPGLSEKANVESFSGPWRSIEGLLYYRTNVARTVGGRQAATLKIPGSVSSSKTYAQQAREMHYPTWGDDGLYLVSLDQSDSVRIGPKPVSRISTPPEISYDRKYYIHGGTICRLVDSTFIVLDTIAIDFPPGTTGCNIIYSHFNPVRSEVLFTIIYSDMDEYEVKAVGTYDLETKKLVNIDALCQLTECDAPSYSPTGAKIALASGGRLYIVYRAEDP